MNKVFLTIALLLCICFALSAKDAELALWIKADDLVEFMADNEKISIWKDARVNGLELKSEGDGRPILVKSASLNTPSVYFGGAYGSDERLNTYMQVPLAGEWQGTTIFVVGTGLGRTGIIDTAPGSHGCLRTCGWLQITGTTCGAPGIPYFSANPNELGVLTLSANMMGEQGLFFDIFENGRKSMETSIDPNPTYSVRFLDPRIGHNNRGEGKFYGEIKEVLYYNGIMTPAQRMQVEAYLALRHKLIDSAEFDEEIVKAHEFPFGYTPKDREKEPLPEVKAVPYTNNAVLWLRADDISDVDNNKPIVSFNPTIGGAITSNEGTRPIYVSEGVNNRPSIKFEGNHNATPRIFQYLNLPITGEATQLTIAVVGTNLMNAGVIDTAPGGSGCLRQIGFMQLTGSDLAFGNPFHFTDDERSAPQMIFIILGIDENGKQYLETYANGYPKDKIVATDDKIVAARFSRSTVGTNNLGESGFNGLISEVMIFPEALNEENRKSIEAYFGEKFGVKVKTDEELAKAGDRSMWTSIFPHLDTYSFSWYGNTFSGDTEWVQSGISGINVYPDGTVLTTSIWDEPHKEIGFYKDGKVVDQEYNMSGGFAKIAYDDKYIYAGKSGMGEKTAGIARYVRNLEDKRLDLVPFEKGNEKGHISFEVPNIWQEAAGIAVTNSSILLTVWDIPKIFVFNKVTGEKLGEIPIDESGPLALDKDSNLWLGNSKGAFQYSANGKLTGKSIPGIKVTGLFVTSKGELVVTDGGENQQVVFFDVSGARARELKRIGEKGGVYAGPVRGAMGPNRLYMPTDVAVDSKGILYVNCDGQLLRAYSDKGDLLWEIWSTVFCTTGDFDPRTDGNDLYTRVMNYKFVPNQEPGKDWKMTGVSIDTFSYPEIARATSQNQVIRELNGEIYRYSIGHGAAIHKKVKNSEIFAPIAYYNNGRTPVVELKNRPDKEKGNRYIWADVNGNGIAEANEFKYPSEPLQFHEAFNTFIDSKGDIWEPQNRFGVLKTPLGGFTQSGAPVYDLDKSERFARPAEFIEVLRCHYFPETDTMYLSGYTWENPASGKEWNWGCSGREAICYTDWSKDTRKIRSRMPFPEPAWDIKAMWVLDETDLLFAAEAQTSVVFVYNTLTGELLGILEPDPEIVGAVGWVDTDGSIRAFAKKDGSTLVIVEDSWAQKEMIYHVKPIKTK